MCFWTCSQSILTVAQKMSVHDEVNNDVKNQNGGLWYIPGWCHRPWSDLFMNKNTGIGPIAFTLQSHPLSPKPTWPPYEPSGSRKVRRMRVDPTNIWWPTLSSFFLLPHPAACGLFPDQRLNLHLLQWKRRGTTGPPERSRPLPFRPSLVPWLQSVSSFGSPDTCLLHHFSSRSSNLSSLSFNGSFPPLPTKDKSFWRVNMPFSISSIQLEFMPFTPPMLQLLRRHFHLDISL